LTTLPYSNNLAIDMVRTYSIVCCY